MKILTARQMQGVDRRAIEELGIPGMVLMENAAVGVADGLGRRFPEAVSVAIFCGPGNNGGDGLALARILDARGYGVSTFLVTRRDSEAAESWGLEGDAAAQLGILHRAGRLVTHLGPDDEASMDSALRCAAASDVVIDALFGTGLSRPLEGHFATLVEALARLRRPLVAVDLPSGLDGSRGAVPGPHLRADLTVTFAAPKIAHVTAPACDAIGELAVVDLGIPPELVEEAEGSCYLLTEDDVAALLAVAEHDADAGAHKGSYGHVLLIGGSPGKSGAVVLAARAAVQSGAGLVTAAVPRDLLATVDGASVESMTVALNQDEQGLLAPSTDKGLTACLAGKSAVALGPGLGRGPELESWVRRFVLELELPLVIDADGLNAVAGDLGALRGRPAPTVLTPHPGEAGRLLGRSAADVQEDRLAAAAELAQRSGSVVALKGFRTVVAVPDGSLWINPTGDACLATGGTGDVLTGMIVALAAQGHDLASATKIAVFVHGLAGEEEGARRGRQGVAAGHVIEALGPIWRRLSASEGEYRD